MEKYENFINRKSGVLKVESEGIPNLCVWWGMILKKES